MDPLPAAEVRRRGDRRRRRSNALATLGGVAAAAALVVPLALAARGTDRSEEPQPIGPSPSTASSTAVPGAAWRQRIPAGFDLTALPAGATFSWTARDTGAVDRLRLCGTTVLDTGPDAALPPVDTAGAVHREAGTASASARTLALYRDDATAATVLAAVEDAVRACPVQRQDPGARLVQEVLDTTLPAEESVVFTQQSRMDARLYADLTVVAGGPGRQRPLRRHLAHQCRRPAGRRHRGTPAGGAVGAGPPGPVHLLRPALLTPRAPVRLIRLTWCVGSTAQP